MSSSTEWFACSDSSPAGGEGAWLFGQRLPGYLPGYKSNLEPAPLSGPYPGATGPRRRVVRRFLSALNTAMIVAYNYLFDQFADAEPFIAEWRKLIASAEFTLGPF